MENKVGGQRPIRDSRYYDTIWTDERDLMRVIRSSDKDGKFQRMYLEVGQPFLLVWNRIDITELFLFLSELK